MGKLKHPNIVELNQWFETEKRVYLIMELAKDGKYTQTPDRVDISVAGDVLSILNRAQRPLPEETVQNWFVQLIDALSFAHARNFVHGDLRVRFQHAPPVNAHFAPSSKTFSSTETACSWLTGARRTHSTPESPARTSTRERLPTVHQRFSLAAPTWPHRLSAGRSAWSCTHWRAASCPSIALRRTLHRMSRQRTFRCHLTCPCASAR